MSDPASDTGQPEGASAMSTIPPARAALLHPATTPGCGKWASVLTPVTCALTRAIAPQESAPPLPIADAVPPVTKAAASNSD